MPQVDGYEWQFYRYAREAWDAMYQDISAARRSVDYEQYIIGDDAISRHLVDLLVQKRNEGVSVRLLCDGIGSRALHTSNLLPKLQEAGCEVRFYNPFRWDYLLRPRHLLPRNHTKLLLIDREIAHIGGVCFDETMRDWRDTMIRMIGPPVAQARDNFRYTWEFNSGDTRNMPSTEDMDPCFEYVSKAPAQGRPIIFKEILTQLQRAERYAWLSTPFFCPNRAFLNLLRSKAKAGVDVRLLLASHTDHPFVDKVSHSYVGRLIKAGVRVYVYEPCVMHAKNIVIDDAWATTGSSNLDYLSFFRNHETNVFIRQKEAIAELKAHFEEDFTRSVEAMRPEWNRRPWIDKLLGRIGRIGKYWM